MIPDFNDWRYLPDLILEKVFLFLPQRDRLSAALACKNWFYILHNPCLWKSYVCRCPDHLENHNHRVYYDLETIKLSKRFHFVGYCFYNVTILPMSNYFYLNRVLNVLSEYYSKAYSINDNDSDYNILDDHRIKLESFDFEFDCQFEDDRIYGTGGGLLLSIKMLLDTLRNLKSMTLKSLFINPSERGDLLALFIKNNKDTLIRFSLLDLLKIPSPEFDILHFHNLIELELSPYQINGDLLINLGQETRLALLKLTQTKNTLFGEEFLTVEPIQDFIWQMALELNPFLKVYQNYLYNNIHEFEGIEINLIYQPRPAPVVRNLFLSNNPTLLNLSRLEQYQSNLKEIIIFLDNSISTGNLFSFDLELLYLTNNCFNLRTLILGGSRFTIHSITLGHIVTEQCKQLKEMIVEYNSVIFDNTNSFEDVFTFNNDLVENCNEPKSFIQFISKKINYMDWKLLSRDEFLLVLNNI